MQSLDVYAEGKSFHLLVSARDGSGAGPALLYAKSSDAGATWSDPVRVGAAETASPISRRGNDAQLAVAGARLVAAWQGAGDLPGAGPITVAYSDDGGSHWTAGDPPASGDPTRNQSYLDLLADASGAFHLVWLDDRDESGNAQGLRYTVSQDGGSHWRPETTIDREVCTCCWNRLLMMPNRQLSVLYRDVDPHDMKLAVQSPESGTWQTVSSVGQFNWKFTGCPHCGGGLVAESGSRRGRMHGVVWTGQDQTPGLFYLQSADSGRHWRPLLRVSDGHGREGDIALQKGGKMAIVYVQATAEGASIRSIHSKDGGANWSPPQWVSDPSAEADHPRVFPAAGGFRVFWTEKRAGLGKVLATAML